MVLTEATIYLYVHLFDSTEVDWDEIGNSPYLDSIDESNRVEELTYLGKESWFHFQESALTNWIKTLKLQLYCKRDAGTNDVRVTISPKPTTIDLDPPDDAYGWIETQDLTPWIPIMRMVNLAKLRLDKQGVGQKVYVACARLEIVYYENTVDLVKNPTSNEEEQGTWQNPANAYADGGGVATADVNAAKQWYKEHHFTPADMETILKVFVRLDAYRSAVGDPNVMRYSISKDGGANFTDRQTGLYDYETTWQWDFTGVGFTPADLADGNLVTRIWSGSSGCLTGKCEVGLWIENMDERKRKKDDKIDVIRVDELWDKYDKGERLPLLLGWDWEKGFGRAKIQEIKKHENVPCYRLQTRLVTDEVPDETHIKDVEGSATHLVWEVFHRDFVRVQDLQLGDVICGLYWNETLDDYELRSMSIIQKVYIGLKTVYEVITDKVFCFAHSSMFKVLKW